MTPNNFHKVGATLNNKNDKVGRTLNIYYKVGRTLNIYYKVGKTLNIYYKIGRTLNNYIIKMDKAISDLENGEIEPIKFATNVFDQGSYQEALDMIMTRMQSLDQELRSAVCANSDELLQNASDVKFLRDRVTALKQQITRTRNETEQIAISVVNPFKKIKTAAENLQKSYAICKILRKLQRFFSLVNYAEKASQITTISGSSNEIRRLCEIYTIAQKGELQGINAFDTMWKKMKPMCENLINLANEQFTKSIQTSNINDATTAAVVFDFLENLQTVANDAYQREVKRMSDTMKDKLRDPSSIIQKIKDTISILAIYASRVNTIYQAVSQRMILAKSNSYDLEPLDPIKIVDAFSSEFKGHVEGISRNYPEVSTVICNEIPAIRQSFVSVVDRLPDSINKQAALAKLSSSVVPFQESLVSNLVGEMRQRLIGCLTGKGGDVKGLCDDLKSTLLSYDEELVLALKKQLVKLARDYQNLKGHQNQRIATEAMRNSPVLCRGLVEICNKFYHDETAKEIEGVLMSTVYERPPPSPSKYK